MLTVANLTWATCGADKQMGLLGLGSFIFIF